MDEERGLAFIANTRGNILSVVDLLGQGRSTDVSGVGKGPEQVAVDPEAKRVYVTTWYSGSVAVVAY